MKGTVRPPHLTVEGGSLFRVTWLFGEGPVHVPLIWSYLVRYSKNLLRSPVAEKRSVTDTAMRHPAVMNYA